MPDSYTYAAMVRPRRFPAFLSALCLLGFLAWAPGLTAAETTEMRLLFLRHGDLWSALPTGADQRIEIASEGTIVSYAVAPQSNHVAVVRRLGGLDALEIHDLVAETSMLVRTADGFIDALAWTGGRTPHLGYAYVPSRESPPQIFLTRGGAGTSAVKLAADERLLYFYPAQDGVIAIIKYPAGLRWLRCTASGIQEATGFPGKTITAMPIDRTRWIASLYAPGVGRALQLLETKGRHLVARGEATLPRADLTWSTTPVFMGVAGEPLKVALRSDVNEPGLIKTELLVWDVLRGEVTAVKLPGEVLLDRPLAESGGKHLIYCSQLQDGGGYGTPPMLWRRDWHGAQRKLLIADGSQAAWWRRIAPAVAADGEIAVEEPAEEPVVEEPVVEKPKKPTYPPPAPTVPTIEE